MKLDVILKKAAPFLLIVILIACLMASPQIEGMKGLKHDVDHEIHHEVHYANHVFHSPKQDTVAHFSHTTGSSMTDIDNEWYDWVTPPKSPIEKSLEKYKKLPERDEMNDEFGDFDSFKKFEELPERDSLSHLAEDVSSSPAEFDPTVTGEGMLLDAPNAAKTDDLTNPKDIPSHFKKMGEQLEDSPVKTTESTVKFAEDNPDQFDDDVAFDGGDGD